MNNIVRLYFSFRSPYSWLALYRVSHLQSRLPVEFELVPCFPPADNGNAFSITENKKNYIVEDIKRFTDAYGLDLKWPDPFDTDWKRPHSAFIYAHEQSAGMEFCLNAYRARFVDGRDIGRDDVIMDIAMSSNVDSQMTLAAANEHGTHRRVLKGIVLGNRDGLFGVPLFIYGGRKYWGNDRLEWLIRDIYRQTGREISDLKQDPLLRPF